MSKQLLIVSLKRARDELNKTRSDMNAVLGELERPVPDYFAVVDRMERLGQHLTQVTGELNGRVIAHYEALVESWKTEGEPPQPGRANLKPVK